MIPPELARRLKAVSEALRGFPFVVLVWGPGGTTDSPARRKRIRVREEIKAVVGEGYALFSEDMPEQGLEAEYTQALAADAVILIPESPGSLVEAALFHEDLRGKSIVFAERREHPGFAEHAYATLKVEYVEPEEWEDCGRVRRKARQFVEALRFSKFRRERARFDWE